MFEKDLEKFREINKIIPSNGIVFVGADYFAELPVNELASAFNVNETIHNRSLAGIKVVDVIQSAHDLVFDLNAAKIFFNLGETEAEEGIDVGEFISAYEWLLYLVHADSDAEIFVVSLAAKNELYIKYNAALEKLCKEIGCRYIDISSLYESGINVFNTLKYCLKSSLDFAELMTMR